MVLKPMLTIKSRLEFVTTKS